MHWPPAIRLYFNETTYGPFQAQEESGRFPPIVVLSRRGQRTARSFSVRKRMARSWKQATRHLEVYSRAATPHQGVFDSGALCRCEAGGGGGTAGLSLPASESLGSSFSGTPPFGEAKGSDCLGDRWPASPAGPAIGGPVTRPKNRANWTAGRVESKPHPGNAPSPR